MSNYLNVGDRLTFGKEGRTDTNGMILGRGSVKLQDRSYPILPNGLWDYPIGYVSRVANDNGVLSGVVTSLSEVWLFDESKITPSVFLSNVEVAEDGITILSGRLRAVCLNFSDIQLNKIDRPGFSEVL